MYLFLVKFSGAMITKQSIQSDVITRCLLNNELLLCLAKGENLLTKKEFKFPPLSVVG